MVASNSVIVCIASRKAERITYAAPAIPRKSFILLSKASLCAIASFCSLKLSVALSKAWRTGLADFSNPSKSLRAFSKLFSTFCKASSSKDWTISFNSSKLVAPSATSTPQFLRASLSLLNSTCGSIVFKVRSSLSIFLSLSLVSSNSIEVADKESSSYLIVLL
jgi:hypothetical protein